MIPNPRLDRELEADDRLLCFGRLEAMRDMIPDRKRRRPRLQPLPDEPIPVDPATVEATPADTLPPDNLE